MVCVDTVTGQPCVIAATSEFPAVQPLTGKRTLMPALYCPACKKWHAVPPPDQISRTPGAGQCRRTGVPLIAEGPLPAE